MFSLERENPSPDAYRVLAARRSRAADRLIELQHHPHSVQRHHSGPTASYSRIGLPYPCFISSCRVSSLFLPKRQALIDDGRPAL